MRNAVAKIKDANGNFLNKSDFISGRNQIKIKLDSGSLDEIGNRQVHFFKLGVVLQSAAEEKQSFPARGIAPQADFLPRFGLVFIRNFSNFYVCHFSPNK